MLLPTTKTGEIDVDRVVTLLKQANTPNDNDALDAFRQAEALVYGADKDWRELIPKQQFRFDLDNLPPLLRESDIVRDPKRGYPGILPMTRSAFRSAVEDGYIPAPLKLGAKVVAWRREAIIEVARNGVKRRPRGRRALARETQRITQHTCITNPLSSATADEKPRGDARGSSTGTTDGGFDASISTARAR